MRKSASALVLLLFLSIFMVSLPQMGVVKADEAIYIRDDGTVEGTDRISRDGNVYTFLENISIDVSGVDSLIINRDNIIINGAGYRLDHLEEPTALTSETGILIESQTNVTITNLTLHNFLNGIEVINSSNIKITQTNLTNNYDGIRLSKSQNNSINDNHIMYNHGHPFSSGIALFGSEDNRIERNIITANSPYGIRMVSSSENIISNNCISKNSWGIYINYGGENQIFGNAITENSGWGVMISSSNSSRNNNIIYRNNFINNQVSEGLQVSNPWYFGPESNNWDNGEEGNYWSDYTTRYHNAAEVDDSGIWNNPFFINEYNIDHYPLMEPVQVIPEFPSWTILPILAVSTLVILGIRNKISKNWLK